MRVHASINGRSLLFAKDKMNNFMFNVKQFKMNKFIKYIWQLIISTSNDTLVVSSLRPWYTII